MYSIPGWSHPGNICAHGLDDSLAKHDEPQGDTNATIEGDEYGGLYFVFLDETILG
jgi:hypothetical protein